MVQTGEILHHFKFILEYYSITKISKKLYDFRGFKVYNRRMNISFKYSKGIAFRAAFLIKVKVVEQSDRNSE